MKSRIPLIAAVVGVLLVGGATTGSTLAVWRDQTQLAGTSVTSGSMALTVNGETSATFSEITGLAMNGGSTAGEPQAFTATLLAGGAGKNLRIRVHLDDVTTSSAELDNGLEISLARAASSAGCPAAAVAAYQPLSSMNNLELTDPSAAAVVPGTARVLCVAIRVKAGAPATTGGKSGLLTFNFRGEQV